jgi:archaellum biogenesis ATPase FlaH
LPGGVFIMEITNIIQDAHFVDIDRIQPEPIITIGGRTVATQGNFITISGLPKSFKTSWVFYMIASGLLKKSIFDMQVKIEPTDEIILIDTEQSVFDFARQVKILKYSLKSKNLPSNFNAYLFRKYEPEQIIQSINTLMAVRKPKLVILDNITELVNNPNDIPESKKFIQFLKRITDEYNCVIICILHLSKSNLSTLGNLGSYADRAAQTTLKVTMDKDTQISTLEAVFMRSDMYFNPISIQYSETEKTFVQTESVEKKKPSRKFDLGEITEDIHRVRVNLIFQKYKDISYKELVQEIKNYYGVGDNLSKKVVSFLLELKLLSTDKGIYRKL